MAREKLLLVEDDPEIAGMLKLFLQREGFQIVSARTGSEALTLAKQEEPQLIILDILLPELDGFEVCRILRQQSNCPILLLSCKSDEEDKVLGLRLGADDYLTKPFSPRELIARINAHLRRIRMLDNNGQVASPTVPPQAKSLVFEGLEINPASHEVLASGKLIALSAKEFHLLYLLAQRPNQVFSMEQLYNLAWGASDHGDSRTVMVHIRNLRKKIEPVPSHPRYILTIRGVGYKFSP